MSPAGAGITQPTIRTARTRKAQRHPTRSIRNCVKGTRVKIPRPIPAEAIPTTVPNRLGNQPRTSSTAGIHPAIVNPTAVIPPNAR